MANTSWSKLKEGTLDIFKDGFIAKKAEAVILLV